MTSTLFDLTGKRILITGATQGIGAALAIGLGEAGATLVINGRDPQKIENAVRTLTVRGIAATGALCDLNNSTDIKDAITRIEEEDGPIDVLVNNAGIIRRAPAELLEEEDWNAVILTNLTGPFLLSKYAGRYMIKRRAGKIINICSLMSEVGRETVSAYAAAKGGLKMLTKNLASEWGEHNIQVNGIGPGYIATPINENYRAPGNTLNDYIINRTPAGRWGRPDDLAGTAIFLASAASDFVNGQIIYVDGGLLASFGKPSVVPITN